jgi:HD superfamily phosphohydrolase
MRRPISIVMNKRFSVVRDPVHGDIYLTHEELSVLDTREMQRLRGIKQLGTAHLVYPGATHTRFEHSIGCVHLAQRIIDAVNRSFEERPRECLGIGEEEARVIRLAALVHDVTHIPYGHNVEDQAGLMQRHDSPRRFEEMLSGETEVGQALARARAREEVLSVLAPQAEGRAAIPPYWSQINADTICSDILDYLQRDAHYTGLRIQIDERLLNYFRVDRDSGNLYIDLAKHELLREDILSEVVRMLEARYYFSERVYYHHAKVAAGVLVSRAVELVLQAGLLAEKDFYGTTDASLVDALERAAQKGPVPLRRRVLSLLARLRARELPKRVCVFPAYANREAQRELVARFYKGGAGSERSAVEERISDLVRFATGRSVEIALCCPSARMQLKEAATHVRWPGLEGVRPLTELRERVPRLSDLERSYSDLWKFYVFADSRDKELLTRIQAIALGEFTDASNVFRIGA